MNRLFLPLALISLSFSLPQTWAGPTPAAGLNPAALDLSPWRLETLKTSSAVLTKGTDGPSGSPDIIVEAQKGGSGEKWLVQLDYPISVTKGKTYHLKFMAKATPDHYVYIGCSALVEPYASLADGKSLEVSGDWQEFEYTFMAKADESNARILLTNLNQPGAKYYIASMTLDSQ